ncbi:unnamed protein product, partial [marine sediment metagenome]
RISTAPSRIADTAATINSLLELHGKFPGQSMYELREGESRQRRHYYYQYKRSDWNESVYLNPIQEFTIKKSAFQASDWQLGDLFIAGNKVLKR